MNTAHSVQEGSSDFAQLGSQLNQTVGSPHCTKLGDLLGTKEGMSIGPFFATKARMSLGQTVGHKEGTLLGSLHGSPIGTQKGHPIRTKPDKMLGSSQGTNLGTSLGSPNGPKQVCLTGLFVDGMCCNLTCNFLIDIKSGGAKI